LIDANYEETTSYILHKLPVPFDIASFISARKRKPIQSIREAQQDTVPDTTVGYFEDA
jgi:hypothetical protein